MGFQKIIVTIDHSDSCSAIFSQATELAKANKAALMLFHCLSNETIGEAMIPLPVNLGLYPEVVTTAYEVQNIEMEKHIQQAQTLLRSYCDTATSQGLKAEFDYKVGDSGQELCQLAETWGADLIVMGRRGRKGLTEAMLGSVSNYVMHNAPCSVLVIQ